MELKNVLFPTDFSTYNAEALDYASCLASDAGAKLHFVHVQDTRDLTTTMGEGGLVYADKWDEARQQAERELKKLAPTKPNVQYEHQTLVGMPDAEIVGYAKEHGIDLIVMASHGRTGLSRLLMGSVAEGVMRKAPCPVLVVKQPHTATGK